MNEEPASAVSVNVPLFTLKEPAKPVPAVQLKSAFVTSVPAPLTVREKVPSMPAPSSSVPFSSIAIAPEASPSAAFCIAMSVPAEIVTPPVNVFVPESVSVPAPETFNAPVPEITFAIEIVEPMSEKRFVVASYLLVLIVLVVPSPRTTGSPATFNVTESALVPSVPPLKLNELLLMLLNAFVKPFAISVPPVLTLTTELLLPDQFCPNPSVPAISVPPLLMLAIPFPSRARVNAPPTDSVPATFNVEVPFPS